MLLWRGNRKVQSAKTERSVNSWKSWKLDGVPQKPHKIKRTTHNLRIIKCRALSLLGDAKEDDRNKTSGKDDANETGSVEASSPWAAALAQQREWDSTWAGQVVKMTTNPVADWILPIKFVELRKNAAASPRSSSVQF